MKKYVAAIPVICGFGLLLAILVLFYGIRPAQVTSLEESVFDQYQRWLPRQYDPDSPVRVVEIDDAALAEFGQWPWPRTYHAELARRLVEAGAAVVVFDILFTEPDRTSPAELARSLPRFGYDYGDMFDPDGPPVPDHDATFGWIISQTPTVLSATATNTQTDNALPLRPSGMAISGDGSSIGSALESFPGAIPNLAILEKDAFGVGLVVLGNTENETIRKVPLFVALGADETPYPALSIEAIRVALGAPSHRIKTSRGSGEIDFGDDIKVVASSLADFEIPLDEKGRLRIHYSTAVHERAIPAVAILGPDELSQDVANEVAGRIVFVGVSALGAFDLKSTPLHPRIPGVHIHAELTEQILSQRFLQEPDWMSGASFLLAVTLSVVTLITLMAGWGWVAACLLALGLALVTGGSWWAFVERGILFNPLGPMFALLIPYLSVSAINYLRAEGARREVSRQFANFVPPDVVADIARDPGKALTPQGAERELTILFLDMRGFSTLTENMEPEEVVTLINDVLTPITDAILDNHGTVDKYIGDAVMAFWNAPRERSDHAVACLQATSTFDQIIGTINKKFEHEGRPRVGIGVGINTGMCAVGNLGSRRRMSYSCLGDAVNLAARLEALTRTYGTDTLVGARTVAAADQAFSFQELDIVAVKGRDTPERISTLLGPVSVCATDEAKSLANMIEDARRHYAAGSWDQAIAQFSAVQRRAPVGFFHPEEYASSMLARCKALKASPPADWDGVLRFNTK